VCNGLANGKSICIAAIPRYIADIAKPHGYEFRFRQIRQIHLHVVLGTRRANQTSKQKAARNQSGNERNFHTFTKPEANWES
jgi:hypothetical protein